MLKTSLRKYGAGRSVLVDREGRNIAGNKTVETTRAAGMKNVAVIETDGETLVAVQRRDVTLNSKKSLCFSSVCGDLAGRRVEPLCRSRDECHCGWPRCRGTIIRK